MITDIYRYVANQLRSQEVSTEEDDADYVALREGYVSYY